MKPRPNLNIYTLSLGAIVASCVLLLPAGGAQRADAADCVRADRRVAATGRGDRDHDGVSNCREKSEFHTDVRDPDTDDDGLSDGEEVKYGTDALDRDSDDDGVSDGVEVERGSDPLDDDSDHDGVSDADDLDPLGELRARVAGPVTSVVCPTADSDGVLSTPCLDVVLTADTRFRGSGSCEDLARLVTDNGGGYVEVELDGDGCGLSAVEVVSKDADNDGSPDDIDADDDNYGVPDVGDVDDSGNGGLLDPTPVFPSVPSVPAPPVVPATPPTAPPAAGPGSPGGLPPIG